MIVFFIIESTKLTNGYKGGTPKTKELIDKWFSNRLVGIIGTLGTILGIILALYFYLVQIQTRNLTYYVNPIKVPILQLNRISNLEVYYKGEKIDSDLTATQILIWNNGEKSIRTENILSDVKILTEPPVPIIEAQIIRASRPITKCTIDTTSYSKGIIPISWKIFEHNDGAVIQLIYKGSTSTKISVEGVIEEQPNIQERQHSYISETSNVTFSKKPSKILPVVQVLLSFVLVIFFLFIFISPLLAEKYRLPKKTYILYALVLIGTLYMLYQNIKALVELSLPSWY